MDQKKFTGIFSSTANPGDLSLTISSLTQVFIGLGATYAVVHGLDSQAITTQIQGIIATATTALTACYTAYHALMTLYGLVRKLWYTLFAK